MALQIPQDPVPIQINADGVALVGGTRVRLETIVSAFLRGDSPEQIVDDFDVLSLADVYDVIAYYINHRAEADAYIRQQDAAAEVVRQTIEANAPEMLSLRARLLERKAAKKQG
jgi:uncharacterized protein (DUF433 family)